MTTVASMICADGFVMGSDTKVVAGSRKWSENKLEIAWFGNCPLVVGGAGNVRHVRDAMKWMELDKLTEKLGTNCSFDAFLDGVVEKSIPEFARDFELKYQDEPELNMLFACIDEKGVPQLIELYPNGDYDRIQTCSAIGSGSIFAEILLRKLYKPSIKIDFAEKLIAYILWEVQGIDNDSGEHMQIIVAKKDKKLSKSKIIHQVSEIEIEAYKQLPSAVSKAYEHLAKQIQSVDIESIKNAVITLQKAVGIQSDK